VLEERYPWFLSVENILRGVILATSNNGLPEERTSLELGNC